MRAVFSLSGRRSLLVCFRQMLSLLPRLRMSGLHKSLLLRPLELYLAGTVVCALE